ncbi:winged helix-turn-helix transcriptional regulator [Xenorhabdus sp. DI]|uniref:ArsR/SmtB family transcription factor n=1 Tax=Xenorhabdus TaxID=626 RepID=UPI0019BE8113|nr:MULTISPECIES: winged helix-turn-helix domain-containing protein [unclassified Xenorhabdus]MBD2784306.1 winged helix-turn-helix transcriptional regulator [Xenorhabdus sp. 3]MBD2789079.1 winged helix-turn-helix transcriptional regulator [Xenorhabdus sp. DI]MBD2796979.1 winged helix-turn-helix transcriptional regulator [Xenorhabdus sp. 18]MDC9580214.1 winged helix-turn-helix domain-containing protein [Xenorhabdus sp. PR6a]
MKHEEVAASLAELGNIHRLSIFRFLIKAGHQGVSVGEIQKALGIPASTLSHHLSRMVRVGLIRQDKHSRTIVCIPEYQHLENLINFLQEECCVGVSVANCSGQSATE